MVYNEEEMTKKMGSWAKMFRNHIESKEWDMVFNTLKTTVKAGKTVIPSSSELFKPLLLCNRQKLKAVIIAEGPMHTLREGKSICDGIPMSCSKTDPYKQSQLWHWYQSLDQQYGFNPDDDQKCDIPYLLSEENVLIIGSSLSTIAGVQNAHTELWSKFIQYMITEILNPYHRALPIVLIGNAQKYEQYIIPMTHHVLKVESMANATNGNRAWRHMEMHKFCNDIIEKCNGLSECIQWTRSLKPKEKEPNALKTWLGTAYEEGIESVKSTQMPWED